MASKDSSPSQAVHPARPDAVTTQNRDKAIDLALAAIDKQFGKGAIMRLGKDPVEREVQVIPTGSTHPREAWAFIRYTHIQDRMQQLCLGQRKHSPLAQVSELFYAQHPNPYIRLFAEMGASPNAWSAPKTGVWNEYGREMNTAADKIANLTLTPQQALSSVQERIQTSYDRDRAIFLRRSR